MKTIISKRGSAAKNLSRIFGISAAVLGTFLSHAGADRPARAAVENLIEVRQTTGVVEYAYDSTGWRPLRTGKALHAGATVRTAAGSSVLLKMETGSLVRVGPMRRLELAKAAPSSEFGVTIVPVQTGLEGVKIAEK